MAGNVYQNVTSLGIPAIIKTNKILIEKKRFVHEETNHMFLRVDSGEAKIERIQNLDRDFLSGFEITVRGADTSRLTSTNTKLQRNSLKKQNGHRKK